MNRRKTIFIAITVILILLIFSSTPVFTQTQPKTQDVQYQLLIITPKSFQKHLQPLEEHKEEHGLQTKIVTPEKIYDEIFWKGRDSAEKIKYFIKKAHEEWNVEYVLLVGGKKHQSINKWWLPVRYSYLNRDYDEYPETKFLTDLYFADIYDQHGNFSSWDEDHDQIYGEWPQNKPAEDTPDLKPDVYVGRLPCRNQKQVKDIVNKIIQYENQVYGKKWFDRLVVVAGDTYPEKTSYIDGERYTQQAVDIMANFTPIKIWASQGNLNLFNIIKNFNQGAGFIWFSGHGSPNTWATHPPDDSSKWIGDFKNWHTNFLFNRGRLPVCISGSGCFVNMFNVSFFHSPHVYGIPPLSCWGWKLTKKPNGGSIACIGSTGYSYESPDIDNDTGGIEWLDMHFFQQYKQNHTYLGETWAETIDAFLDNHTINWNDTSSTGSALIAKNVEQWLLIGDPSLKIGGYPN